MPNDAAPTLLLNADQAAKTLGISRATLRRISQPHGDLPVVRFGSGVVMQRRQFGNKAGPPRLIVRYRLADLEHWINTVACVGGVSDTAAAG
jgi:hypothetical protein